MKILVVAGEPLAAFELTSVLEDAGHEVIGPAHSVSSALSMVQHAPADLALLSGEQGMQEEHAELVQALHEQQGTVSVLVKEAQDQADDAEKPVPEVVRQPKAVHEPVSGVGAVRAVLASGRPARTLERLIP